MATMPQLNVDSLITRLLDLRGRKPSTNVCLTEREIKQLCEKSKEAFLTEPVLLELKPPLKIIGDINGQYYDLLRMFELGGFPPHSNYLFLGNYVDVCPQSIETICLLLAYKIKFPEKFFLIRGNHECDTINRINGFYNVCTRRYNLSTWKSFNKCFKYLPVAATIDNKIFCCHGGLSPELQSVAQIHRITRPAESATSGLLCDLLCSNPSDDVEGFSENNGAMSVTFGPDVVDSFLRKHNFDLVCRSHQLIQSGYKFFANQQLVTVFSAPNYKNKQNEGTIMNVDRALRCSFQIIKPDNEEQFYDVVDFEAFSRRRFSK